MRKIGLVALLRVCACSGSALGLASCGSSWSGKEGGTLTGTYAAFPDYLDPALSYTSEGWTAMYDTYIPLLTYAHADGAAGSKVIPGLAKALPKISDGGKTYTLILRHGLKYSDGTPVKASDFTRAVERDASELDSGGSPFYTDIVGAEKFAETKKGGIPGIETDDKTGEIVIHLIKPRGTFTNELGADVRRAAAAEHAGQEPDRRPAARDRPLRDHQAPSRAAAGNTNATRSGRRPTAKLMPRIPSGHVDKIDDQRDPQPLDPGQRRRTGQVRLDAERSRRRTATRK